MEDKYQKLINGEIDIKYLSPIDLVNIMDNLENEYFELDNQLKMTEYEREELKINKDNLKKEISDCVISIEDII